MTQRRIVYIGLGGNSYGPLTFALYAANCAKDIIFVLVDGKEYRPSQADHEFFVKHGPKPIVQALLLANTYPSITTIPITKFVDRTTSTHTISAADLVKDGDYVITFVDNHETRRLLAEHAQTLDNITLISGAIDGNDVHIWIHLRRDGENLTRPPLQRYPDINVAPDQLPASMFQRTGCLEEAAKAASEERPNYFALVTASIMTLNALSLVLTLDATGSTNNFPYEESWFNVHNARAVPTRKEQ